MGEGNHAAKGEDDTSQESLQKICPNCMTSNTESAHLCRACFSPLSAHASIDPMMSITSRVDTFRKASDAPRKPIVLVGMWLIFGPAALAMLVVVGAIIWSLCVRPTLEAVVSLAPSAVLLFIAVALLIKTTVHYFRRPMQDRKGFQREADEEKMTDEMYEGEEGGDEAEVTSPD